MSTLLSPSGLPRRTPPPLLLPWALWLLAVALLAVLALWGGR